MGSMLGGIMGGGGGGGGGVPYAQIGSTIGASASYFLTKTAERRAAGHETDAQNRANALYTDLYNQTSADYKPYQEGGASAFDSLLRTYGIGKGQNGQADYSGFENSPDYQFALDQGQKSLDRSAASRGRLYSGAQMQASQKFGQGLATQNLGNYRTGLGNISQMGVNATNAMGNIRQNYGNQLGGGYINLGDIAAAQDLGVAAAQRQWYMDMNDTWGAGAQGTAPVQQPTKSSVGNSLQLNGGGQGLSGPQGIQAFGGGNPNQNYSWGNGGNLLAPNSLNTSTYGSVGGWGG